MKKDDVLGVCGLQELVLLSILFSGHSCAFHVDGALADGDYELVPAREEDVQGGDVNVINIEAAPNTVTEQESEGKPRSIT